MLVLEVEAVSGREAQRGWAARSVGERLRVLRAGRFELARVADELVRAISPELVRTRADSYVAEVLPLLAACRFLEDRAERIQRPRKLGRKGLPFWLAGVETVVERVPFGVVLVIAPSNYPLFLAGVQALQALAAGNAVVWKPGLGGAAVAEVFAAALERAGLPEGLLRVTDDSREAGAAAMREGVDKIFFTGSGESGRAVLRAAAENATPVVAELSGCDAVVVLESAERARVVEALAFGMRLNGSATCMAPRRLMLVGAGHDALLEDLRARFAGMQGIAISAKTRRLLRGLMEDAELLGATVYGDVEADALRPMLVLDGSTEMALAGADVFAPVLLVLRAPDEDAVMEADRQCPFGLTAAVFGEERKALALGRRLEVGTVLVNDLIVPTADPRVSFGGRRGSGFGSTRGAEGLLEMTAVKTVAVRRMRSTRQYQQTTDEHEGLFAGVVQMSHGATLRERFAGLRRMTAAATKLK